MDNEKCLKCQTLKTENERMRKALDTIRWNTFATNPQSMIMKDIANKALYPKKGETE